MSDVKNEIIAPYVRIKQGGMDIEIRIEDVDDIAIVHQAVDLAFKRWIEKSRPTTLTGFDRGFERNQNNEGDLVDNS